MFNFVSMWNNYYYPRQPLLMRLFSVEIGIDIYSLKIWFWWFCKNVTVAIGSEIVCSSSSFLCKHCTVSDVPVRDHLAYNYASCATIGKYNNNIDSFLITRSAVVKCSHLLQRICPYMAACLGRGSSSIILPNKWAHFIYDT